VAGALWEIAYNGLQKCRIDHAAVAGWNRSSWLGAHGRGVVGFVVFSGGVTAGSRRKGAPGKS
jgi:hypothetical protein